MYSVCTSTSQRTVRSKIEGVLTADAMLVLVYVALPSELAHTSAGSRGICCLHSQASCTGTSVAAVLQGD